MPCVRPLKDSALYYRYCMFAAPQLSVQTLVLSRDSTYLEVSVPFLLSSKGWYRLDRYRRYLWNRVQKNYRCSILKIYLD
jgi:hypothetical protein